VGWIPDDVLEDLAGSHFLAIFMRIDTVPPIRIWAGLNDVPAGIESKDPSGAVYLGAGRLMNVPELDVLINGIADRVMFMLPGIDPTDALKIDFDTLDIRGASVDVGITTLDEYYQPRSRIIPLWPGFASFVTEDSPPPAPGEKRSVTLSLSAGSGVVTRDRNSAVLWSPAHHRALFPTDAFCDGTARLARGVAPAWPRF
jgi:hypothetical protein